MNVQIAFAAVAASALIPIAASAAESHGHHNWGTTTSAKSRTTTNSTTALPREYAEADATCFFENRWVRNTSGERVYVKARVCY